MSQFPSLAPLYALASAFLFALSNHFSNFGLAQSDARTGTIVSIAASAVVYWLFAPFFIESWYWATFACLLFALVGIFRPALSSALALSSITHSGPTLASALTVMAIAYAVSRRRWPAGLSESVMAALSAGYVNSANLGIPIAIYVLGDATHSAPLLLVQLLLFTPISMTILDSQLDGAKPGLVARLTGLFRNPITVGALLGLVVSLTGFQIPEVALAPLTLIGNLAVPGMLVAFGISLRLGQRPGEQFGRLGFLAALKLVVQPVVAGLLALALGIRGHGVLVSVVMAALPTAQNIFTYALRYEKAIFLTRDAIFVTTFGSVPVILLAAALLH